MKIGYSYWGFLGDVKYDQNERKASTPDGNAFYSWSIIWELQRRGHTVYQLMPNRDKVGFGLKNNNIFSAWCHRERTDAYVNMDKSLYLNVDMTTVTPSILYTIWDRAGVNKLDMVLHEWRMEIPGRNTVLDRMLNPDWQPDLMIQDSLIDYCAMHNIPLILFDLDYKIDEETFDILKEKNPKTWLFELGDKWSAVDQAERVEIPFRFASINEFDIHDFSKGEVEPSNLVYIGNRYERDWCIDKYIPTEIKGVTVYGNWKESGRDSEQRWPNIRFGHRLQTEDMRDVYGSSIATILLAKQEYCDYHFMTARIIEAIFYGTVPLFIEEYGEVTIKEYAGVFADFLTVRNKADVIDRVYELKHNPGKRTAIIGYLREHLKFMDAHDFVDKMMEVYNAVQ